MHCGVKFGRGISIICFVRFRNTDIESSAVAGDRLECNDILVSTITEDLRGELAIEVAECRERDMSRMACVIWTEVLVEELGEVG